MKRSTQRRGSRMYREFETSLTELIGELVASLHREEARLDSERRRLAAEKQEFGLGTPTLGCGEAGVGESPRSESCGRKLAVRESRATEGPPSASNTSVAEESQQLAIEKLQRERKQAEQLRAAILAAEDRRWGQWRGKHRLAGDRKQFPTENLRCEQEQTERSIQQSRLSSKQSGTAGKFLGSIMQGLRRLLSMLD